MESSNPNQENQNQNTQNQNVKPCVIKFPYRSTRYGGYDNTIIISLRKLIPIKYHLHLTKSGRHGDIIYYLLPGRYFVYNITISNLGNAYIDINIMSINEECKDEYVESYKLYDGKAPVNSDIPENLLKILRINADKLPYANRYLSFLLGTEQPES